MRARGRIRGHMTASPFSPFDRDMMRVALRMGARGLGSTAPNPAVGAVIADLATGEVIARGWTQPGGRPHAETEAIGRAGARARGATLYVTLEPCAHQGKTPPCADAIIAAGLARVVIGVGDPDPRTAGAGVARLTSAGVDVCTGVCEAEAHWLTLGHILRMSAGRPFVTLKIATDPHGGIAEGDGQAPRWVTGPEARAAGHGLRARADAILVGSGTVLADDPELTCRLPGLAERSPVRVVLAGARPVPQTSKLVRSASQRPLIVIRPGPASAHLDGLAAPGVQVIEAADTEPLVAPGAVLGLLAERGITRVLVEGGPRIWRTFAADGVVDEIALFTAGTGQPEAFARSVLQTYLGRDGFKLIERRPMGGDTLWRWADPAALVPLSARLAGPAPH